MARSKSPRLRWAKARLLKTAARSLPFTLPPRMTAEQPPIMRSGEDAAAPLPRHQSTASCVWAFASGVTKSVAVTHSAKKKKIPDTGSPLPTRPEHRRIHQRQHPSLSLASSPNLTAVRLRVTQHRAKRIKYVLQHFRPY